MSTIFSLRIDPYAAAIAAAILFVLCLMMARSVHRPLPFFYFSNVRGLNLPAFGKARLGSLFKSCSFLALLCFLLAFIDPHFGSFTQGSAQEKEMPSRGIAIYLLLDQSGSMAEKSKGGVPKITLLKGVTEAFIKERPSDLIGVITFARTPQIISPLTLDHAMLLDQIERLHVVASEADDGTALGYAIYKTAHIIAATKEFANEDPVYDIKSSIMIVVTDGFQDPSPLDAGNRLRTIGLQEAATYAKKQKIRLYIINVDPIIARQEFAPHRRLLNEVTEMTGGKFYYILDDQDLTRIYQEINLLEKSDIPNIEERYFRRTYSLYPLLLSLGLLLLLFGWCVETLLLKRSP